MTTIVYDHENGLIASDSRITSNDRITSNSFDKHVKKDNEFWFFCGCIADNSDLMALEHNDKPDVRPDSHAIVACDGDVKLVAFNGDYCSHQKLSYNFAIGSGADFASSAIDFNCSASEAVDYAAKRDPFTGGMVRVFDVKAMKFLE